MKLNILAFGLSAAVFVAGFVLLLGILYAAGVYRNAAEMVAQTHLFYSPQTVGGIISGMLETFVHGFLGGVVFAWIYNKFAR